VMVPLQISCFAIVALFIGVGFYGASDRGAFLRRYLLITIAAWFAEESCILGYGFYQYSTDWWLFVGEVPLAIALIWPGVIITGLDLFGKEKTVLFGVLLTLADASFIEPIAVQAKLWSWNEPGIFGVPPIGILGWAYFAGACGFLFRYSDRKNGSIRLDLPVLVIAPIATHILLLATWWGALRWVNFQVPDSITLAAVSTLSVLVTLALVFHWRVQIRLPITFMTRIAAAIFFFTLLGLTAQERVDLIYYCLAFSLPWCAASLIGIQNLRSRMTSQSEA